MKRIRLDYLQEWLVSPARKPLVIRGARQVGKTWLVRHLAEISGKQLIELNLERQPQHASLFMPNEPKQVLLNLEAGLNQKIDVHNSLLFIDEIQAAPELFAKLRWFAEDLPELPVIAAGSLLEFVLAEHSFSMPVGRISYMHLEPLSFEEFLLANEKQLLFDYLNNYTWNTIIPSAVHDQLMALFRQYILVGGLPAAVANWIDEHSPFNLNRIQHELLTTYRDDFAKYKGRLQLERLDDVMQAVPKCIGHKFVFSRINPHANIKAIKQALYLLSKAQLCSPVLSCTANGIPLAAESNEKHFKVIFLDVGLTCAALQLTLTHISSLEELNLINNGSITEQVVGQLLRTIAAPYIEPHLYYWQREEQNSNAEIDYLIQHGNQLIPIEVKAGSTGSLKSLHVFMGVKNLSTAIRINSDLPSKTTVKVKNSLSQLVEYNLLSIPVYLTGQIHRLLETLS